MDAYRVGLTGAALDYAVKKFKSHRKIRVNATREKLEAEFLAKKRVKIEVNGVKRRAVKKESLRDQDSEIVCMDCIYSVLVV